MKYSDGYHIKFNFDRNIKDVIAWLRNKDLIPVRVLVRTENPLDGENLGYQKWKKIKN